MINAVQLKGCFVILKFTFIRIFDILYISPQKGRGGLLPDFNLPFKADDYKVYFDGELEFQLWWLFLMLGSHIFTSYFIYKVCQPPYIIII